MDIDIKSLKEYLQKPYESAESFLENVIFKVFGEEFYETAGNLNVFKVHPELKEKAEALGIVSIKMVGQILVEGSELGIFDITVTSKRQLDRSRVDLQEIVRRIISTESGAFMIFHYKTMEGKWDWRFTFCRKGASLIDSTDAKRYTFLLGPGQSCRTAAENFIKLGEQIERTGEIELKNIETAFDVEALSKEFFKKYKDHYERFCQFAYDNRNNREFFGEEFGQWEDKTIRDYIKKLLGRLVFLHFLQKKGWMGVPADKEWGEGDVDFMRHLWLNSSLHQKENYLDEVLEPLFSDALDTDRKAKNDLFDTNVDNFNNVKIPYLNGGLFERDYLDAPNSRFPVDFFENLFEFFYEYNFTIDENDPNDSQVGVDPEMLGMIFENLLEDNKDKGAFYTPKEIVLYMCKESLIAYLQTNADNDETKEAIRQFVTTYDVNVLGGRDSKLATDIDKLLLEVKICDPAIGSGAFPMGLLKELFYCRGAIENFSNASGIKKHIIQNNIYGVDIEKGAVDIARLRFWLSLIVDEETPHALPNMDFKIMQGNSLLEQYNGVDLSHLVSQKTENNNALQLTFFDDEVDLLRHELQEKININFNCADHELRHSIRKNIKKTIQNQLDVQRINLNLNEIDVFGNSQFFLWHTFFADVFEKGGFDIVIGNPPYKILTRNNTNNTLLTIYTKDFKSIKSCYSKNLYTLFIEHGVTMLAKNDAILSFIIPEGFFKTRSYNDCVNIMNTFGRTLSTTLFTSYVFDNAVTGSLIFLYQKNFHNSLTQHFQFDENYNLKKSVDANDFILSSIQKNTVTLNTISTSFKGMVVKDREQVVFNTKTNQKDIFLLGKSINKWAITNPYYTIYERLNIIGGTKNKTKHDIHPRILIRRTGDSLCCAYIDTPALTESTLYSCWSKDTRIDNKYLYALLNSSTLNFYNRKKNITNQQGFPQILLTDLKELPIKIATNGQQQPLIYLVNQIHLAKMENPQADTSSLEAEINQLVYKLYELTPEEIAIIEGK